MIKEAYQKFFWSANFSKSSTFAYFSILAFKKNCNAKIIVSNYDIPNKPSHCKFLFEGELGSLAFHENTN